MVSRRHWVRQSFLLGALMVACAESDKQDVEVIMTTGGAAGTSGAAGSSGKNNAGASGTANSAGKGGTSSGGASGTTNGGAAGTSAGASGASGKAGASGTANGGASGSGTAGASGAAGSSAGSAGTPALGCLVSAGMGGGAGASAGSAGASGSAGAGGTSGDGGGGAGGTAGSLDDAGTDASITGGAGGASGDAGSAGASGTAGASGSSGASGDAGTGGSAGASAGAAGSGGSAGSGGNAGASAGTAGSAGSAGTGGTSNVLFFDDFENGASAWTVNGGTWSLLTDGSQAYAQTLIQNKLQISAVSGTCFADQIVEAKVKINKFGGMSNSYQAAVFARYLGADTHYFVALNSENKFGIEKRVNSTATAATVLGSLVNVTYSLNTWYTVRLEVVGTTLTASLNGVPQVTVTDTSIASGGVALGTTNTTAEFDDVTVTHP